MSLTPEALYLKLGRLVAEMPDLSVPGPVTREMNEWMARVSVLVDQVCDLTDQAQFRVAIRTLNDELRRANVQTITSIAYRALARAELDAPVSTQGAFIAAGDTLDAFAAVGKAMASAKATVLLVDPYADDKVLTDFAVLAPEGVTTRVLADEATAKPSLKPAAERWSQQFGTKRPLEVRLALPRTLHDRLIFADHSAVWFLGQSFNALATRAHTALVRVDPETAAMKIAAYETIWATARSI